MKKNNCLPQTLSKTLLGSFLGLAGLGLLVIGITILPVFGVVLAVPVLVLAGYILYSRLNDQCEIDFDAG